MNDLALQPLFFKGCGVFAALPDFVQGHGIIWWVGFSVLALILYCLVIAYLWRCWGADFFFGPRDYDDILFDLLDRYQPAQGRCLIMSKQPVGSSIATKYWPAPLEAAPILGRNVYGVVLLVVEKDVAEVDHLLGYAHEVLCYGGVLAIVRDGLIVSEVEKN